MERTVEAREVPVSAVGRDGYRAGRLRWVVGHDTGPPAVTGHVGVVEGRGGVVREEDPVHLVAIRRTAEELQADDAACIGDHRRVNVRLGLVIEELLRDVKALVLVGSECEFAFSGRC